MLDVNTKHEVSYCIPITVRDTQIRTNISKVAGRIQQGTDNDKPIAIVGYGPSLADTWQGLRSFKHIITCSGSHKYLLEKGLKPSDVECLTKM